MWTKHCAVVTLASFLTLTLAACAPDDSSVSSTTQAAMQPPKRPPGGGGKPKPTPKPAGEAPTKGGSVKPEVKKPGTAVEPPAGEGAKPKAEKEGTRTRSYSAKEWSVKFAKWGIIGVGFIKLAELVIKTALEAIGSIAQSAFELWKKIIDAYNKNKGTDPLPPAPAPPPGGVTVSVTCTETETELVCVATIPGDCDPTALGPNERCIDPTDVCTNDGDGCDPEFENCCGADIGGYCVIDPAGGSCDPSTNPCCTDEGPALVCDTSGGWVDPDAPGACGPEVTVDVCEPVTDDDGDGTPDYCVELADGSALGGGHCCGDIVGTVELCVCEIWYCDDATPTPNCLSTVIPGSEFECSDVGHCDLYALPDDPTGPTPDAGVLIF